MNPKDRAAHGNRFSTDQLLASQIAYYRAHAPRYDDWWFRQGRHDLGQSFRAKWTSEISKVRSALVDFLPHGDLLELAGGTGNWTIELAQLADSVTVVDASPEALSIARQKVPGQNVSWVIEDIFAYRPGRQFDVVFFAFWLSHIPLGRFAQFWELVDGCLAPEGRVFFIDNAGPERGRALADNDQLPDNPKTKAEIEGVDSVTNSETGVSTRLAADGETYEVMKIWWEPEELRSRLERAGWNVRVASTEWAFIFGHGSRAGAAGATTARDRSTVGT